MLADFDRADVLTAAAALAAVALAVFAGWNCLVDMRAAGHRRRGDDDTRRLAAGCAGALVGACGTHLDERKRAAWKRRFEEVIYDALSAEGTPPVRGKEPRGRARPALSTEGHRGLRAV